jgi:hypothetical protein
MFRPTVAGPPCHYGLFRSLKQFHSRYKPVVARRRSRAHGPAVYFPGSSTNEVETAADDPITFALGEPYTLALPIRWTSISGTQGIFRSGSSSNGTWLWMISSSRLWGRHANVDGPASGDYLCGLASTRSFACGTGSSSASTSMACAPTRSR